MFCQEEGVKLLFNSAHFLLFFPIVALLYFLIPVKSRQLRLGWLLFCSYYFYMCWNPEYADSFGAKHEGISTYGHEDGIFDLIRETGMTKHVFVGHDHVNNWSISYKGIRLTYITKCGMGNFPEPQFNGGTVVRIGSDGIRSVEHDYVDIIGMY